MRRSDKMPAAKRFLCALVVGTALAALLASGASAVPGTQLWKTSWPSPVHPNYEILTEPVLARGPGSDLWVATTGVDWDTRDRNYVLLRYAPSGTLRWALETGASGGGSDYVSDVAVAADGSAVLTGNSQAHVILTIKVSPQGKRVWERKLVSEVYDGEALGKAVATDSRRNVYVLGSRERAGRGADVLLVKYSPSGARLWTRYLSAGGSGDDVGVDVAVGRRDCIVIAGTVQTQHNGKDILVARFTPGGTLEWKRVWDGAAAKDDAAVDLAVSKAGVAVCGSSLSSTGVSRGVVLTAKLAVRKAAKLRSRISTVPGRELGWLGVAINAAGDVAAGGKATVGVSSAEFTYAMWLGNGGTPTFQHYTPLSGSAACRDVALTGAGTLFAAGALDTGASSGVHLVSQAAAPHAWMRTTTDHGWSTSLAASADGVCVAGLIDYTQITLWMFEP